MNFTKMHGIGNDFVMVNGFELSYSLEEYSKLAQKVCHRHFCIGSDGLIVVIPGLNIQFAMKMWNPDGSESEMCGNGIRCFAKYLQKEGLTSEVCIPVETGAGLLRVETLEDGRVRVNMGLARLSRAEIGMSGAPEEQFINQSLDGTHYCGTAVSMGNPHIVIFEHDIAKIDLQVLGPMIEIHPLFLKKVNVHFVQVLNRNHLKQRTWERGAGVTLACGTGACASAVASFINGSTERQATVSLPGGDLEIEYREDGIVMMSGPAVEVFSGVWEH